MLFGKSNGFTLIEIVFSLGITSILIFVIGNLLQGSLNYSYQYHQEFNRNFDLQYNMDALSNEISTSDRILRYGKNRLDFCIYPSGRSESYRYISYRIENRSLYRYAIESREKVNSINWNSKKVGKNQLIDSIDNISFQLEDGILVLEWKVNKESFQQFIAIRGDKL